MIDHDLQRRFRALRPHVGGSYPAGEPGHTQYAPGVASSSALSLARAEREGERRGWYVEWEEDPDARSFLEGIETGCTDEEEEFFTALLRDEEGNSLGALGGVSLLESDPARAPYGRVVAAELVARHLPGFNDHGGTA